MTSQTVHYPTFTKINTSLHVKRTYIQYKSNHGLNQAVKEYSSPFGSDSIICFLFGGTSTKAKDKGDEAHAGSIERSLYHLYLGDDEKKIPSHVGMFCDMTDTFARFVAKGYATVTTTEMTDAASTNASVAVTQTICFDLEKLFRYKMSINLDDTVCRGLKLSTLSPTSKLFLQEPYIMLCRIMLLV